MNSEFQKDVSKIISKQDIGGELTPGSVGRRYDPIGGVKAHNKRIHRESEFTDKHKNMPFTFSKPKAKKKPKVKVCENCGHYVSVTKDTVGIICQFCHTFAKVVEVPIEKG